MTLTPRESPGRFAGRAALAPLAALLFAAAAAPTCPAQSEADPSSDARTLPPPPRPSEGVHFKFTADAWFPRLNGDVAFDGLQLDVADDLGLDGTQATFDGRLDVQLDLATLSLSGFSFESSGSATARSSASFGGLSVAPGDPVDSEYSIDSIAFEAGFALWRPLSDQPWPWSPRVRNEGNVSPVPAAKGDYRADLRFVPLAGVRWIGLEQRMDAPSGSASFNGDWVAMYGGLGLLLTVRMPEAVPFLDRIVVGGSGAFGGFVSGGSGTMWQVRTGIDLFITANLAISAGYQLLEIDADEGGYDASVGLQGLFIGGSFHF
ncbi:MAG TPA: hypothetical protein PKC43_08140 [Phycisphaerales bacterium]|nr:hypothetical protein [Phycisphaerales bacterium]HMP37406.1 hypothetical protein [Phycisphaerales bacterium]